MSRLAINRRNRRNRNGRAPDDASSLRVASPLAARAGRIGLWALVVLGACGGVVGAVRPAAPVVVPVSTPERSAAPADVAGMAELAVRRFLSTGASDATTADASSSSADSDGAARFDVVATATVASRRIDENYWAVTVAADVRDATAPARTVAVWFLEVGVLAGPRGQAVVGTPAVVAPPDDPAVRLAGPALAPPRPGDPLAETAASFLQALLTGTGDVTRYLAPRVSVAPASPPPFTTVTVQRTATVAAGIQGTVLRVEAAAVTPAEGELLLVYELTLQERDGRWEIRSLSGAPTFRRQERPEESRPSSTTSPPTTTVPSSPAPGA